MNKNINGLTKEDEELLQVIHNSNLTLNDIIWLKNKKRFKKFILKYAKEIKKKINKPKVNEDLETEKITASEIEVLDFTKTISVPSREIIEILDFTSDIDTSNKEEFIKITETIKRRMKIEQTIWFCIIGICLASLIFLTIFFFNWSSENKKTEDIIEHVKKISSTNDNDETLKDSNEVINFDNLLTENPDTKGWIKVNNTNINYPFVQALDNDYYLTHSFDKSYTKKGWIFLDYRNNIEKLDKNTIIYGHGLVNDIMFGTLRKVVTKEWYSNEENRIITITTPNKEYKFEVFSTYTIEPESYYITTDFNTTSDYQIFIDTLIERSVFNYNTDVTTGDKILTLSSCYNSSKRIVLHAKLMIH